MTTVLVEMSTEQVDALGAVTGMLVDVDRTINQLLAVKDGLLALGSRLAMEIGADAVAAMSAEQATGMQTTAAHGATGVHTTVMNTVTGTSATAASIAAGVFTDAATGPGLSGSHAAEAVELTGRAVAAEFAAALRVSDRTVQRRMGEAESVVSLFPAVWRAQGAGRTRPLDHRRRRVPRRSRRPGRVCGAVDRVRGDHVPEQGRADGTSGRGALPGPLRR